MAPLFGPDGSAAAFATRSRTLGASERVRRASRAEAFYAGLQYEGRVEWHDRGRPLRERKPRVQVPLFREAVDALDHFIWSGHRPAVPFVAPTREPGQPPMAGEVGPRLEPEAAGVLTRYVRALVEHARIDRAVREAGRSALVGTSSALIVSLRNGRFLAQVEPGRHCVPTWDVEDPRRVGSLEILYQFYLDIPGLVPRRQLSWYRRTIDAMRDVVYKPCLVVLGQEPVWEEDLNRSVDHALGFCPVVWVRTLPATYDAIDGRPVIDPQLYPLLEAVDQIVSQRHRAVEYGCDPQLVRKGLTSDKLEELQKAPGKVWDVPAGVEVEFLEPKLPGAAAATEHLRDLRERFLEAVNVVVADQKNLGGKVSGLVLELLHRPMIALASDLRFDLGDEAYCQTLSLALRMTATVVSRAQGVWIPGSAEAGRILLDSQLAGPWLDPPVKLDWPAFFEPTADDRSKAIDDAIKAQQAGLVSSRTAMRSIAPLFGIEDLEAEEEEIEREKAEAPEYGPLLTRDQVAQTGDKIGTNDQKPIEDEPIEDA